MKANKIMGIVLIGLGLLALIYGGFSYNRQTSEAKIGSFQLSVKQKKTINVPMWVGVGAVIAGGVLMLAETPLNNTHT